MTPLDELRSVHEQQRALVLGHWTEEYIGRAVRDMERQEAEIARLRATLLNIQSLAERGDAIDCGKLATRCRLALIPENCHDATTWRIR